MAKSKKTTAVSFDPIFDKILSQVGIAPDVVEAFLAGNKKQTRIAVNALSLTRIAFGYIAIQNYEKSREKGDKKAMAANICFLGFIMATDAFDGYISRKAHIAGSKTGKIIDSVSDVALRLALAKSSLSEQDNMAAIRGIGELLVATDALPDIMAGNYTSTNLGKIKVTSDTLAILTNVLKDVAPDKTPMTTTLQLLHDTARTVATTLAIADGVKRVTGKK
jgi:phosphatidylglycerophosphate synthase